MVIMLEFYLVNVLYVQLVVKHVFNKTFNIKIFGNKILKLFIDILSIVKEIIPLKILPLQIRLMIFRLSAHLARKKPFSFKIFVYLGVKRAVKSAR